MTEANGSKDCKGRLSPHFGPRFRNDRAGSSSHFSTSVESSVCGVTKDALVWSRVRDWAQGGEMKSNQLVIGFVGATLTFAGGALVAQDQKSPDLQQQSHPQNNPPAQNTQPNAT